MSKSIDKVSIKFKAGAYGAYRSMNNKVWYALAEFVDNALQSYLYNKNKILSVEDSSYKFTIYLDINLDEDFIRISDNAGGIDYKNFTRAFEPANIPLDNTGLSEFGMGMKIASIWLADFYSVRTSAINEKIERLVSFDLNKVILEEKEELNVENTSTTSKSHFTEVYLKGLSHNAPSQRGRQLVRIKNHLRSIYRKFLRTDEMKLVFNGEELIYEDPEILNAPFVDKPGGKSVKWKKKIAFEFGKYKVNGFIGLLKEMSTNNSGISLFRRGRVIQGSHDEKYHPKIICGQAGSPRDKRLFGELELEGFRVSFDKGKFTQINELEELLGAVKKELNKKSFNLLKQGDRYRKQQTKSQKLKIINKTLKKEKQKSHNEEYKANINKAIKEIKDTPTVTAPQKIKKENQLKEINISFPHGNQEYNVKIKFVNQPGLLLCDLHDSEEPFVWKGIINLSHDFFEKYKIISPENIEPVLAILKALLLSEVISASQGTRMGGYIRQNLDKILKTL